jgi:hypothetical protein
MNGAADLRLVSPRAVLEQVANAIPEDCRANIIIIGSLAVGYYFFGNDPRLRVHTKDVDCLLSPRVRALPRRQGGYGTIVRRAVDVPRQQ